MRYQYRFTKDEKRQLAAANRVLDNPTAPPREVNAALRHIQRIQDTAEARAFDGAVSTAEPEPTVADLVSALEKADKGQKPSSQPIAAQGLIEPEKAEKASEPIAPVLAPSEPAKASEVTPTVSTTTAFCGFCSTAGNWNTASGGVILCPTCFAKVCAADMRAASAASLARQDRGWLYEKGIDPNINDLGTVRGMSSDYRNSVEIWRTQALEDADRRDREATEPARAEAEYNNSRARWIQDGGKL